MQHIFAALLALVLMPLLQPISRRALKHTRAMQVEAFAREDGLWDLDAHIADIKARDGASADAQSHNHSNSTAAMHCVPMLRRVQNITHVGQSNRPLGQNPVNQSSKFCSISV